MKKLGIIIWTGDSWEPWGPSCLSTGLGGSETAVIHMSHELASLGHEVTCIGKHQGHEGVHGGVTYVDFTKVLSNQIGRLDCDILISSRDKRAYLVPVSARKKILWVHDLHVGDDWNKELLSYDKIFCLSQYARSVFMMHYAHVDEARIHVTRNGIDAERYLSTPSKGKVPRFFFSSSPDRGLDVLLFLWPRILAFAPEAELHIFYGFDTWTQISVRQGDKTALMRIQFFRNLVQDREKDGIYYHGRTGQHTLAQAQLGSALWLYPTAFKETYCITALEAQAAGALPVTTALGALNETVKRGVLIPGVNTDANYQRDFVAAVKSFLLVDDQPEMRKRLELAREEGREWALRQTWRALAFEWSVYFNNLMEEAAK